MLQLSGGATYGHSPLTLNNGSGLPMLAAPWKSVSGKQRLEWEYNFEVRRRLHRRR